MHKMNRVLVVLSILLILGVTANFGLAQDLPPAQIINDEGGPVVLTGEVTYTNPFFTEGVDTPLIILEDQAGFVDRDLHFLFPPESQTLGQITSNFFRSPFTYSLALPIEPQGSLRDVDNDGEQDTGVMVFAVAYWNNVWGDPFLEARDQQGGGWSGAYASTRVSEDPDMRREIVGGKYLIYAPDDQQGFPSGFGADSLLFTEDDPIVSVPQGYTVVDLDADPFTFDRSRAQDIDLIEPQGAALVDFSSLPYDEAFDAMIEKLSNEYAFTEYKDIDWDKTYSKYQPFFAEAAANNDSELYLDALSEIIWSFPDGHVNMGPINLFADKIRRNISNGIGLSVLETDARESYAVFVLPNGPADRAGIEYGAEILAINGRAMADHITTTIPWAETTSTEHNQRLAKMRYATRFPVDVGSVEVTYQNPGAAQATTVQISTVQEFDSYSFTFNDVTTTGYELPVEYQTIGNGLVYVKIYGFLDNQSLTIQLWERLIRTLRSQGATGLIIDMRQNGGGFGFIADQMTAYFFNEPLVVGSRMEYSEEIDAFFSDERDNQQLYLPSADLRFNGPVAVLVGPNCASACERFAYNLTLQDRATVVGHYPTAGLGGGVEDFRMPMGITVRVTVTRSVDNDGNIHIEGLGVAPTLDVPITRETLFSEGDPILQTAVEFLNGQELSFISDR